MYVLCYMCYVKFLYVLMKLCLWIYVRFSLLGIRLIPFVYMCRKVDGGEIRRGLEIVYRRWTDSRSREFDLRGCSLNFDNLYMYFPHLWCNSFILNYVLFFKQWDPIPFGIYVSNSCFMSFLIKLWYFRKCKF